MLNDWRNAMGCGDVNSVPSSASGVQTHILHCWGDLHDKHSKLCLAGTAKFVSLQAIKRAVSKTLTSTVGAKST